MKTRERIVHFDKELTTHQTMCDFVKFCIKKNGNSRQRLGRYFLPFFSLLLQLHLISAKTMNEYLIKWFCPSCSYVFESICFRFAKTIQLTQLGMSIRNRKDVLIVSESPKSYVQYLYPNHRVVAPDLKTNEKGKIIGLNYNGN